MKNIFNRLKRLEAGNSDEKELAEFRRVYAQMHNAEAITGDSLPAKIIRNLLGESEKIYK